MRHGSTLMGWLGVALGLWLLLRGGGSSAPVALNASRMLTYPVEDTLRFALTPGEAEVKVVSWLESSPGWLRDVRVTAPYCLNFRVTDPEGAVVRDWPIFVRARGGLVRTADGRLHAPNWLAEGENPISDDRMTRVNLEGLAPEGGVLELSRCWTPPGARVLATVFRLGETGVAKRIRRLREEPGRWQQSVTRRFSPFPWERLPDLWRDNLATANWERMGALQRGAGRVPTVAVMTTFHKGSWLDESALGVPVPPGGALAFNLEGPTTFRGSWWTPEGRTALNVPTQLRVFRGGDQIDYASGEVHRVGPVEVGEAVVTVEVALSPEAPGPLYFRAWTTEGDMDRAWGDPPREAPDDRQLQTLAPDFRNLELYRALPETAGAPPLIFPVAEDEWVRVLAFARLDPALPGLFGPEPADLSGATLLVRCVDAVGRVLSESALTLPKIPSLFERYSQFDTPASAAPSEPGTLFIEPPPGTVALRVTADAAVDIGVRVTREPELAEIVWRGYQFTEGFEADGRWVPLVRDPWRTRAPEDLERLLRALRAPRVDAQVRLEQEEPDISEAATEPSRRASIPLRSLALWQPFEVIAEPGPPGSAFTRIGRAPTPITVPASGRVTVEYRIPSEAIGATARLRVGDRSFERKLPAASGTLRLDDITPGLAQISVDQSGLFLVRAEGRPAWRTLRVQRLPSEPGPGVAVPPGAGLLVVHPYAVRGGGRLRWKLVSAGGQVLESGRMPLSPKGGGALPLSFAASGLLAMESARVRTGAEPGGGTLYVWAEGAEVYIRATASWGGDRAPEPVHRTMGPAR